MGVTIAVIVLLIAGAGLVWGAMQRASLGAFRPSVSVPSQLRPCSDILERIAFVLPAVPAARLVERDADTLLVNGGPSPRCLSRGSGVFVRISRTPAGVQLDGRAKVPLTTKAGPALVEFERQVRQAVQDRWP